MSEAHIQRLAHFDSLTGLPNRALLGDRGEHALGAARRANQCVALMFLDLDHFKDVNDSLGHRAGDGVLVELAIRLKAAVRAQDTVARLGGDEFMLLLPDTDAAGAAAVAGKILQAAQNPFQVGQLDLTVTPSVGIAVFPADGADLDALSKCADAAMYRAKADGRNSYRFFTREMQAASERTLLCGNALRRALARDQFHLVYQPQISLDTRCVVGAEALVRWQHPELGNVPPGEFIPIAESSGLILPIGEWVIRTAVRQLAEWLARHGTHHHGGQPVIGPVPAGQPAPACDRHPGRSRLARPPAGAGAGRGRGHGQPAGCHCRDGRLAPARGSHLD